MNEDSNSTSPRRNGVSTKQSTAQGGANNGVVGWLKRRLRHRNGADSLRETIEELIEQEQNQNQNQDLPEDDELVIFRNVLRLRDLTARDVMVPRADIVAADSKLSLADLVAMMSTAPHSRMPVYRENLDDVIGVVHIKDVLAYCNGGQPFELAKIVRPTLFVAPSMPMLELLLQMRASRIHMVLVVDEFGGIDGLITIEDLVEEIVGDIEDEHAEAAPEFVERPDGSYLADARVEIEDFEEKVGPFVTAEERDDIDTLGGLVFSIAGRIPRRGEVIRHGSGVEFEVLDADPRRIKRLRVCHLAQRAPAG